MGFFCKVFEVPSPVFIGRIRVGSPMTGIGRKTLRPRFFYSHAAKKGLFYNAEPSGHWQRGEIVWLQKRLLAAGQGVIKAGQTLTAVRHLGRPGGLLQTMACIAGSLLP